MSNDSDKSVGKLFVKFEINFGFGLPTLFLVRVGLQFEVTALETSGFSWGTSFWMYTIVYLGNVCRGPQLLSSHCGQKKHRSKFRSTSVTWQLWHVPKDPRDHIHAGKKHMLKVIAGNTWDKIKNYKLLKRKAVSTICGQFLSQHITS